MPFQPPPPIPVEDDPVPAAPGATQPTQATAAPGAAAFAPPPPIPVDLTPDQLADDPDFEPLAAARARRRLLEAETTQQLAGLSDPKQIDEAYKTFDRTLGADPVYNLYQQAHKARVKKLAESKDYDPKTHFAESQDFPNRDAEVDIGGMKLGGGDFVGAQRDTAADVYAYRARTFGDPDANQGKTDWAKVGHGVKEQAKDAFGVAGALRGTGYLLDDAAYMGRGALAGATGDTSEVARADLAAREVQSGVLGGALSIINLGHGLKDWWVGDDVKKFTDTELREKLEDEVRRKVTVPEQLKVENLQPIGGGQPYKAVLAEAGGAAEAPKADLDFLRFGQPRDAEGNLLPKPSDQQQRAGDIATRLEFSAYGSLMGLPGYRHVVKALTAGGAKAAGAGAETAGRLAGRLIDSRVGRGATLAGVGTAALQGGGTAAALTYGATRLARAGAWLAERTGKGVKDLGSEIWSGKPLSGGTRVGRAVAEGGKAALESGVGATPFVLAAETPEDAISTALGLALQGGAGKFGREALRGDVRNEGTGQELARMGAQLRTESGYDDAHASATAGLTPKERDMVNAVRGMMSRYKDAAGNPLEMHAVDGQTFETVLRSAYPGASEADIADAARARGFINQGNQVFVNAAARGDKSQPAAHEGGHLAQRALAALDAQTRESAKAAVSEALYDANGTPAPEFVEFVRGYNKSAPGPGKIDPNTPEGLLRAEDEFIAEHFRNLANKKTGTGALGALAAGDSMFNRMAAKYDNWAKTNGIRPPDKTSEFNWQEVPEFTARFNGLLESAFKGAHKKSAPEPAAANIARRNARRMAAIDQLAPGEITKPILDEYDALRKENADIGRKLAQIGQKPETPAAPAVAPVTPQPGGNTPETAPAAQETAVRANVQAALTKLGIPAKEAKDLAAQAQGADDSAMLTDALQKRTARKPALATMAPTAVLPKPPALAVAPDAQPAPAGKAVLAATTPQPRPEPAPYGALSQEGIRPGPTPETTPTSHGAKLPKTEPTADDAATEALIAEAAQGGARLPAALDLVTQAAGGNPALLQKRTDPLTGKESYAGRLDLALPEHRALVRELGLPEADVAKLETASTAGGTPLFVDYWSASKLDPADITGKQRGKELLADKAKRSRELMQKDKAIIFTGVQVWPSGKAVQKGISVDKFIANAGKLLEAAKTHGLEVDYKDINDPQLVADLQGYVANHKAGYKGDGSGVVKGKTGAEGYDPYLIPRNRFDLLNAAFNIDISTAKSEYAAKVAADTARKVAGEKVRKRPALRPETELKAEDAQNKALENAWQVDDATGDTNPFRALINREGKLVYKNTAGETRKGTQDVLEGVFENLSPDMIEAILLEPAGERSIVREVGYTGNPKEVFQKGLPDWGNVAAGFMPGEGALSGGKEESKPRVIGTAIRVSENDFVRGPKYNTPHSELTKEAIERGWDMEDSGRGFLVRMPDGTERWVDRKEAYAITGANGQRTTDNTKGELNSQDLQPPPGATESGRAAINKAMADYEAGTITRAQLAEVVAQHSEYFMPGDSKDKDAVKEAAIKVGGKVYTGRTHFDAASKAAAAKGIDPESYEAMSGFEADIPETNYGFVTYGGEFMDRQSSLERARAKGQYKGKGVGFDEGEGLEADKFRQQNTGRFMPGADKPKEEFYSTLERVAQTKIKGRATAEQITATLRNNGVKQEELDWVLGDYLRGKAGQKIEPDELAEVIAANKIELNEKVLSSDSMPFKEDERVEIMTSLADSAPQYLEAFRSAVHEKQWQDAERILAKATKQAADDENAAAAELFDSTEKKMFRWRNYERIDERHKFSQYQLPGGRNYRELLFTLPPKRASQTWTKHRREDGSWTIKSSTGIEDLVRYKTEEQAIDFAEEANRTTPTYEVGGLSDKFKSSHFDEPNIVFHARVNDRTTADGKEILFAEEVQSDWHQAGRKKGYAKKETPLTLRRATAEDVKRAEDDLGGEIDEGMWVAVAEDGTLVNANDNPDMTRQEAQEILIPQVRDMLNEGVPDAPFKGEGWKRLAIKKLLAQAVKTGKAAIGWTTGEQQAERYDLSKQVDTLDVSRNKDGTFNLAAKIRQNDRYQDVAKNVAPEKLEEHIGKDLAKKITEVPEILWSGSRQFSGEDLKVGGEGMKGFYDKELVNIANDIGKRYGARAEKNTGEEWKPFTVEKDSKNTWNVRNPEGGWMIHEGHGEATKEAAEEVAKDYETGYNRKAPEEKKRQILEFWTLPITPELKTAVESGQALFMPVRKETISNQGRTYEVGREVATGKFTKAPPQDEERRRKPALAEMK
jgi:hypothetical protein